MPTPHKPRAAAGSAARNSLKPDRLPRAISKRDNIKKISAQLVVHPPGEPMPNARLFLDHEYNHPEQCLLLHQGGQFYEWDGSCWPAVEDPLLTSHLYRWFEKKVFPDGKKLKSFAPTKRKVADLIDAARAVTIISRKMSTPSWLNGAAQPPADELISCANELIHWPTRTLHRHKPTYYVHHSVPFVFDAAAPPPLRWFSFLGDLWGDDNDAVRTLQEIFGYLISGDTRQQKMFLLVGPKRGGKGTIGRVLTRIMGRHNVAGPTLASLGTNFGLQDLIGKPVAIISDARIGNRSDTSLIGERLLSVSGEDLQNVDRKYLTPWSGYLPTRFVILTNELPRFANSSGALASRFVVLMLRKSFYGHEKPALTEELYGELPIFNWSLDGLQRLRARGSFLQPAASADAIRELEDLASPIGAFVRDRCTIGPSLSVDIDEIYKEYRQWAQDQGQAVRSHQIFGRDLRAAGPEIKVNRPRAGADQRRPRQYVGIGLGETGDHVDHNQAVHMVREPQHCNADTVCKACDGLGCPTCEPERFGLRGKGNGGAAR